MTHTFKHYEPICKLLAKHEALTTGQLAELLGLNKQTAHSSLKRTMQRLKEDKKAHIAFKKGHKLFWAQGPAPKPEGQKTAERISRMEGEYAPPSWPPARPGADDHLKCGSLRDGELTEYIGIIPQCVGSLKQNVSHTRY